MLRNYIIGLLAAVAAYAQGGPQAAPVVITPLPAEEAQVLRFMREEEKMARDLYRHFYQKWNLSIFDRISQSEQRHFEAVGRMLERYNVADPAANTPAGVFENADLQALYRQLEAKGDLSVRDALEAGAAVEKQDIADLEKALQTTLRIEIKRLYNNLMLGSLSHLEAFEECWQVTAQ